MPIDRPTQQSHPGRGVGEGSRRVAVHKPCRRVSQVCGDDQGWTRLVVAAPPAPIPTLGRSDHPGTREIQQGRDSLDPMVGLGGHRQRPSHRIGLRSVRSGQIRSTRRTGLASLLLETPILTSRPSNRWGEHPGHTEANGFYARPTGAERADQASERTKHIQPCR